VASRPNFDHLIARLVQRNFADDPDVRVDIGPSNDVHYRVYGMRASCSIAATCSA
jgi:hypothetical protein